MEERHEVVSSSRENVSLTVQRFCQYRFSFQAFLTRPTFGIHRWAIGGYVSPDGVSADAQHPGYCSQGETASFRRLYGMPAGLLTWRRLPRRSRPGRYRLLTPLHPPNLILPQDSLKPTRDSDGLMLGQPVFRAQKTGPRRCFPGEDHPILRAYHQMAVQSLLYLDPDPDIAGAIGPWQQLKGPPLVSQLYCPWLPCDGV